MPCSCCSSGSFVRHIFKPSFCRDCQHAEHLHDSQQNIAQQTVVAPLSSKSHMYTSESSNHNYGSTNGSPQHNVLPKSTQPLVSPKSSIRKSYTIPSSSCSKCSVAEEKNNTLATKIIELEKENDSLKSQMQVLAQQTSLVNQTSEDVDLQQVLLECESLDNDNTKLREQLAVYQKVVDSIKLSLDTLED
ncbi:hypothetical protein P9112_004065 [Eukaryota sp. TZLM1-RC]